tara:strand:+ start:337 stop:2148 length:1812 start_codon:yes stop_codon:yes gene_type:complete
MVVSGVSMLDVPPLRGNPFDTRPIERNRAHEIVGSQEILIRWKEHMHSQSPRLLLLVGERGSGRTSLINAASSQTDTHFVGYYWHKDDPLNRVLNEIAVTFCGHEVPPTMHQKVERIVETLDSRKGPLPLIAFDYPSEVEISSFLSMILPVLQRLRALVVVSLTDSQLLSLDEGVNAVFEEPCKIEPFSSDQIQTLCDIRIRRMAREKWTLRADLLEAIRSRSGGNARSVVSILRDLIDEKRGLGSLGALDSLMKWQSPENPHQESLANIGEESATSPDLGRFEPDYPFKEIGQEEKSSVSSDADIHSELEPETEMENLDEEDEEEEEDWDEEPEDMWEDEEFTNNEETEILEDPAEKGKITDWSEEGAILEIQEGTEAPNLGQHKRGLFGLASRSRIATDQMPTGPDFSTPIHESGPISHEHEIEGSYSSGQEKNLRDHEKKNKSVTTAPPPPEEKRVFHSEGELWTVDPYLEETLPEPSGEFEHPEFEDSDEARDEETPQIQPEKTPQFTLPRPKWESGPTPDESHIRSLNEAERLVVSIAGEREISPSDAEIQARLEVGRPRLSQIYNSLHKSGILSVRKEGRSRLFKLSDAASDLLREE